MNTLELKIPPPLVALLLGGAMWAVSRVTPAAAAHGMPGPALALAVAVIGVGCAVAGEIEFRRAKTTPNPLKPQNVNVCLQGSKVVVTRAFS